MIFVHATDNGDKVKLLFQNHQAALIFATDSAHLTFHFCSQLSYFKDHCEEENTFMASSWSTLREESFRNFRAWLPGMAGSKLGARSSCRQTAVSRRSKPTRYPAQKKSLPRRQKGPGRTCCPLNSPR